MLKRKLSILVLVIILLISVFGKNGLLEYLALKKDLSSMRAQLNDLKSENINQASELYGITNSKEYLEKKAREELKLSRPEETIYIFTNKE